MNLKPDIDSVKGIEEFKRHIGELITQLEGLDPIDDTSGQMLTMLRLIRRLLEDKEEMMIAQHSRTSEETKRDLKDLAGMVENLLALDELSRQ